MKNMLRKLESGFILLVAASISAQAQYNYTALNAPLGDSATLANGIDGNNIAGTYTDASGATHGFLYNGSSWTTIDDPSAVNGGFDYGTWPCGISGNNLVGYYWDANSVNHGFLYNGSSWKTLNDPQGVYGTEACGISGNSIVGFFKDANWTSHGFLYNGSSWKTLNDPLGVYGTEAHGIFGNNVVGNYTGGDGYEHGFLYNGSSWTTLDYPSAYRTKAYGISGNNIAGIYWDDSGEHGFLYDGSSWTTLDAGLGDGDTWVYGISGNNIVGSYWDVGGLQHGFLATPVPEPSMLALACLGVIGLLARIRFSFPLTGLENWRRKVLPVSASALLCFALQTSASTLYTVENDTSTLCAVDTTTFAVTPIGPLGVTFQYGDLAWNPNTRTLYMVDGRGAQSLYTVNTATGAATLVGPHNVNDLFALAYDSARNQLYGAEFIEVGQLYSLDVTTGAATAIGSGIGERIGALAYNANADLLLALNDSLAGANLYSVNPATGGGTLLQSGLFTNNSGMTYDPLLNRYWDLDVNGQLSYFDPTLGYQQIQVAMLPGSFDGLAFVTPVPEPSALALAGLGAISLLAHRRK